MEIITAYFQFCVDMLIPIKVVKIYPNNRPWVTRDVAHRRQEGFRRNSTDDVKRLQKDARKTTLETRSSEIKWRTVLPQATQATVEKPADHDRLQVE